jgi:hypothetical protein
MRQKIKIIGINILIFLAGYVILDLFLGLLKIPYDYNSFRIKHPYFHHGLKSNQAAMTAWGGLVYPVFTNSMSFRDSAVYRVEKDPDHRRILILGDSHTEAVGVDFKYSFCGRLQQAAGERNIEILNAAAVSYSPRIHYLKTDYLLNKKGFRTDEIWVFVDISDLQNEIAYEAFQPREEGYLYPFATKLRSFLKKRSFTWYTVGSAKDAKKISAFVDKMKAFDPRALSNLHKNTVELYYDFFRDFNDEDMLRSPEFHGVGEWYNDRGLIELADRGLELGQQNMAKLAELCRQHKIRLRLAVHPWQTQVLRQDTMDYYVRSWKDFCDSEGIDFINLFPVFINGENPFTVTETYYIPEDNHWNEAGHELVAEHLLDLLNEDKPNV